MYKPFFNHSHSTHHNHHSLRNQMILRPHLSPRITARVIAHPYFLSSVSEIHRLTKHPPLSSTNPTSSNETHPTHLQLCPKVAQEAARICSLKNFPTHLPAKEAWNIPDSHVVVNTKVGKQADKSKCDQHGPQIYPKLKPAPQSSLPQEPQIRPKVSSHRFLLFASSSIGASLHKKSEMDTGRSGINIKRHFSVLSCHLKLSTGTLPSFQVVQTTDE